MTPQPATAALDSHFLEARSTLLDLAGILDRIGRGAGANGVADDLRLARIREALEILGDGEGGRAERIQQVFSLEYEPKWKVPQPRY